MDLSTKDKIIKAAIIRFNQDGLANVPMQQIAEDLGMSPGNLAYHFRTKEALVESLFNEVFIEVEDMQKTFRIYPNLLDFDLQLNKYLEIIKQFPFYFSDIIEINRHFPELMEKRKQHITQLISQIQSRLQYNAKRGLIKKERFEGQYADLADSVWMLITFYPTRNRLLLPHNKIVERGEFMMKVWTLLQPYFTTKGRLEFNTLIAPLLNRDNVKF